MLRSPDSEVCWGTWPRTSQWHCKPCSGAHGALEMFIRKYRFQRFPQKKHFTQDKYSRPKIWHRCKKKWLFGKCRYLLSNMAIFAIYLKFPGGKTHTWQNITHTWQKITPDKELTTDTWPKNHWWADFLCWTLLKWMAPGQPVPTCCHSRRCQGLWKHLWNYYKIHKRGDS